MNWPKRYSIAGIFFLLALGTWLGQKYIYQPHIQMDELGISFDGSSQEFVRAVQDSPDQFYNTAIIINGKITHIDTASLTLDGNVFFQLNDSSLSSSLDKDHPIQIKGRFIGYDDLLEEVKVDQALIISHQQ